MDNSLLLNLSTPPTGTTANKPPLGRVSPAAPAAFERTGNKNKKIPRKKAAKEQGSKGDEDKENFATPETPRSVSLPCGF